MRTAERRMNFTKTALYARVIEPKPASNRHPTHEATLMRTFRPLPRVRLRPK